MAVTRRRILETARSFAALPLLPAILISTPAQAQTPMRKNIDNLSDKELEDYKYAVDLLIKKGVTTPSAKDGYAWQAALHNDFERVRPDGCQGACEHRNELFFPWHRAHLAGFEALLRASDPPRTANVTLPYWDWTKPASGARFPKAFEDTASPLFHQGRHPSITPFTPAIQWDADEIKNKMVQEKDWLLFAGEPYVVAGGGSCPHVSGGSFGWVEDGPHNAIHGLIGPTMGDPESASRDPIYWSFHAYVDLIWARWQRVHTSTAKPQPFTTPNAKIWVEPFTPVVADTAQTSTMPTGFAYGYDYDFSIDPLATPVAAVAMTRSLLAAKPTGERMMTTDPITVQGARRRLLRVSEVQVLRDTTYAIQAYVHPPSMNIQSLGQADRSRYLADSATVWKSSHAHGPTNLNFDLTKAIAALGGAPFAVTLLTDAKPNTDNPTALESLRATANTRIAPRSLWGSLVLEER